MNLDKLVSSQVNFNKMINETIQLLKKQRDQQSAIKKVILFCKYMLSINHSQCKKYFSLMLIKRISQHYTDQYIDKILDQNIPVKLLKTILQQNNSKIKESQNINQEISYRDQLIKFGVQTINYWSKKLSFTLGKSQFGQALQQIKKNKIQISKLFSYYDNNKIVLGLWGEKQQNSQQLYKSEDRQPLMAQMFDKFNECKSQIQQKINQAVRDQQQIQLSPIINQLRKFLLYFFAKYKHIQSDKSVDKDILVVYYHIINTIFKKISSKFYVPVNQMISITKQTFQANHSSQFNSIDRMDIVGLAGIQKYNAITVFQRIHKKIQSLQSKLQPCQLHFQDKQIQTPKRNQRNLQLTNNKKWER